MTALPTRIVFRRAAWFVLGYATILTMATRPAPAWAQSVEDRDSARQLSAEGAKLMQQGKLQEAVAAFEKAYQRHQDPRYQYNIGVALKALGKDAAALAAFDRFINDAQQVPPEFLADAKRQKDALVQKVGSLEIVCTQADATVLIDGVVSGTTPLAGSFKLDPGSYVVRVEKPGFEGYQESVKLSSGKTSRVEVALHLIPTAQTQPPATPQPETPPPAASETNLVANASDAGEISAADDSPALQLAVSVGMNLWMAGVPSGADPSAAFGLAGDYRLWQHNQLQLSLGAEASLTFLTENDNRISLTSILVNPTARYVVHPKVSLLGRLGLGLLVVGGLEAPSVLLSPAATEVTGALSALELRPSVGAEYRLNASLALFLSVAVAYSPRPDPQFRDGAITRFATTTGAAFSF